MDPLDLIVVNLQVCPIYRYLLDSLAEPLYSDSYLRIVDFSEPGNPSRDSIDIINDKITIAIRLPDDVPRIKSGVLWISDGVMHMLPGEYVGYKSTADDDGNIINMTTFPDLTNKVWNFDLKSQRWDVQDSGTKDTVGAAIAFDAKRQVGWYYGGRHNSGPDTWNYIELQDLYRLDRGKETPMIVETDSSLVGFVEHGELIYIEGAGEAGILVLLGGGDHVSMVGQLLTIPAYFLANTPL